MADIDSRLDKAQAQPIGVTTGPIRGSRKIHVATQTGSGIRVAMREIDLDPHSGEPAMSNAQISAAAIRGLLGDEFQLMDANAVLAEINPHLHLNRNRKTAQLWPDLNQTDAMFIALIQKSK